MSSTPSTLAGVAPSMVSIARRQQIQDFFFHRVTQAFSLLVLVALLGIIGSLLRAPLSRSLAREGTFTYLIPGQTRSVDVTGSGITSNFSPAAWNVGLNLVWYPAGRSRRGLASPYRPLFEVADNGSMIREFDVSRPKP